MVSDLPIGCSGIEYDNNVEGNQMITDKDVMKMQNINYMIYARYLTTVLALVPRHIPWKLMKVNVRSHN